MHRGLTMRDFTAAYEHAYATDAGYRRTYLDLRAEAYRSILAVARRVGARSLLDVGCAYGGLVEMAARAGMAAVGVDLPIAELEAYHARGRGEYVSGSATSPEVLERLGRGRFDLVTVVQTLLHLPDAERLARLEPRRFLFLESSSAPWFVARARRRNTNFATGAHLRSPGEIERLLPGNYEVESVWAHRMSAEVRDPSWATLAAVNALSPTWAVMLRRQG